MLHSGHCNLHFSRYFSSFRFSSFTTLSLRSSLVIMCVSCRFRLHQYFERLYFRYHILELCRETTSAFINMAQFLRNTELALTLLTSIPTSIRFSKNLLKVEVMMIKVYSDMEFVAAITTSGFLVSYFFRKQKYMYFLSNLHTFCVIQERICKTMLN